MSSTNNIKVFAEGNKLIAKFKEGSFKTLKTKDYRIVDGRKFGLLIKYFKESSKKYLSCYLVFHPKEEFFGDIFYSVEVDEKVLANKQLMNIYSSENTYQFTKDLGFNDLVDYDLIKDKTLKVVINLINNPVGVFDEFLICDGKVICKECNNDSSYVYINLPCGHIQSCEACGNGRVGIKTCKVCNGEVTYCAKYN